MNKLRELREARGISGHKLAELLGVSSPYLYDLEKGKRRLNEDLIPKLCEILNVDADTLLGLPTQLHESPAPYITLAPHQEGEKESDYEKKLRAIIDNAVREAIEAERREGRNK